MPNDENALCNTCGYRFEHPSEDECGSDQRGTVWIHPMVSGAGKMIRWHPFAPLPTPTNGEPAVRCDVPGCPTVMAWYDEDGQWCHAHREPSSRRGASSLPTPTNGEPQ